MGRGRGRGVVPPVGVARFIALASPIGLAISSMVWRWPDRVLEGRSIATGTIQLALGSMLAWSLADYYLRIQRRRRILSELREREEEDPTRLTETLEYLFRHSVRSRPILVVSHEDDMLATARRIERASARSGLLPVTLGMRTVELLIDAGGVGEALVAIRRDFLGSDGLESVRESDALDLLRIVAARGELVLIVPVPPSTSLPNGVAASNLSRLLGELAERGTLVFVGASQVANLLAEPIRLDSEAGMLGRGHLSEARPSVLDAPGAAARHLASVLDDATLVDRSIRRKLVAAAALDPRHGVDDADAAVVGLMRDPTFFSETELTELREMLQFSIRGLGILAADGRSPVNPIRSLPGLDESGHLAVKRAFGLAPGRSTAVALELCSTLSDSQAMDVVSSLRASTVDSTRLLLVLAREPRIAVRFSAATRLVKTLDLDGVESLSLFTDRPVRATPRGLDTDAELGARGWVLPSLVLRWPREMSDAWDATLSESARSDPSHLSLSIARGILLATVDHPHDAVALIRRFRDSGPLFWLSELKLVHAAGIAAHSDAPGSRELLGELGGSRHLLVREAADLVGIGLASGRPPSHWTWGLEPLEVLATSWPGSDELLHLLGRTAVAYGLFLRAVNDDNIRALVARDENGPVDGWTEVLLGRQEPVHIHRNGIKRAQLEFGPAFSLLQRGLARNGSERRFWDACLRSAVGQRGTSSSRVPSRGRVG